MINYKIKKFTYIKDSDTFDEAELLVEITNMSKFNNQIYSIDGNPEALREIFIGLTDNNLKETKEIQDYLEDLISEDDTESLSQLAQQGEI